MVMTGIPVTRTTFIKPMYDILDMRTLLKGEEVLSFGLDDGDQLAFDVISVQAKDLYIYNINYQTKEVIQKVSNPGHCMRKSTFFNSSRDDAKHGTAHFKEYV